MIHLRTMTVDDVPFGLRLAGRAGWNQMEADWRRTLDLAPDGCFVAELNGRPAGTTATCAFDSVGWIAMVLVDEPLRRRGVGTRLVEHALADLDRRGMRTVRLDATPLGKLVYQRLGFIEEYELVRLQGAASAGRENANVASVEPEMLDRLIALDGRVTGTNRRRLLARLLQERPMEAAAFVRDGEMLGYTFFRPGAVATQIGPAAALHAEVGAVLGDWTLQRCAGQSVYMDVPCDNRQAIQWAEGRGMIVQRRLTRMYRGEAVVDQPTCLWASFGPEKG